MRTVAGAGFSQGDQLLFEGLERLDALLHQPDVGVQQIVHLPAGLVVGSSSELKQLAHFGQRNVERPEVPDEAQLRHVSLIVVTVA